MKITLEMQLRYDRLQALQSCQMLPSSWEKRFVRDLHIRLPSKAGLVTPRQAMAIERLVWKFRRQLPEGLVPTSKPIEAMSREECEYNPAEKRARWSNEPGCPKPASICCGSNGRWHLCEDCARLPEFRRLKRWPLRVRPEVTS